jgi:hypothetical protein
MLVVSVEQDSDYGHCTSTEPRPGRGGSNLARRKKAGANLIYFMSAPVAYDLQGQGGSIVLSTAATTYTGNIRWIQVVNDAVLSTVASASGNVSGASRLQSITLPAGLGIGGNFSQVILTSGVVIVYFA